MASSTVQDRLSTACYDGEVRLAEAAIRDGASVNAKGHAPEWNSVPVLPLVPAVYRKLARVVVLLLKHGADANGEGVMWTAAYHSTPVILQHLIDVGGDVNWRDSKGLRLILSAMKDPASDADGRARLEGKLRALLAEPALDLTFVHEDKSLEQWVREKGPPVAAALISAEVRD